MHIGEHHAGRLNIITKTGKGSRPGCPGRREMNKISEEKRAKVLEALKDQHKSMKKIAQETGVGMSTVQKIKNEMLRQKAGSEKPITKKRSFRTPYNQNKYTISRY